jgi:hypothetical protein
LAIAASSLSTQKFRFDHRIIEEPFTTKVNPPQLKPATDISTLSKSKIPPRHNVITIFFANVLIPFMEKMAKVSSLTPILGVYII